MERIKIPCNSDIRMLPNLFYFIEDPIDYDDYKYYSYMKITQDGGLKNAVEALQRLYEDKYPDPPELNFDDTRALSEFDKFIGSALGSINYDMGHGFHLDYEDPSCETQPKTEVRGGFLDLFLDPFKI